MIVAPRPFLETGNTHKIIIQEININFNSSVAVNVTRILIILFSGHFPGTSSRKVPNNVDVDQTYATTWRVPRKTHSTRAKINYITSICKKNIVIVKCARRIMKIGIF